MNKHDDMMDAMVCGYMAAPQGIPSREIDGWVYEWECEECEAALSIGVTNHNNEKEAPFIVLCPFCKTHKDHDEVDIRVLYTEDLSEVMQHVTSGNKVAAIKALRDVRKNRRGAQADDWSLRRCKDDVEKMQAEYNDIKGRKD